MADRPLSAPLPADLPEDWEDSQIVAPSGAAVGLSEQHGYNYLMAMVNRAQKAVNTINEGFDTISGKRTCRFVVGTSAAGWTQADCDYLCDGTDDQEEIQAAVDNAALGDEIVILSGAYVIAAPIEITSAVNLCGSGAGATILSFRNGAFSGENHAAITTDEEFGIRDMSLDGYMAPGGSPQVFLSLGGKKNRYVSRVDFGGAGSASALLAASEGSLTVSECYFVAGLAHSTVISVDNSNVVLCNNRVTAIYGTINISNSAALITGTICSPMGYITLDNSKGSSIVANNELFKLTLLNTSGGNNGCVSVTGNNFDGRPGSSEEKVCIEIGEGVYYTTVIGNSFFDTTDGTQRSVQDSGTGSVIRFNSDDTGGGSGGTAGVSSFNSRTGAVIPQTGDYTAAMVEAIPAGAVTEIQTVTQAQYDALATKSATTLYLIQG